MKTYKNIIFDLDGTLFDTIDDLNNALNYSLSSLGFENRTRDQTINSVGNGIKKLISLSVETTDENYEILYNLFSNYYNSHCLDNTRPYKNVVDTLQYLSKSGFKLFVLSNKDDKQVKKIVAKYFDETVIIESVGYSDIIERKPSPDGVNYIVNKFGLLKAETLFVGDSGVDLQTANNSGVDIVCVSYGFKTKRYLIDNGAKVVIDDISELKSLL